MAKARDASNGVRRRTRSNGEGGIREDKKRGRWVATITLGWDTTIDGDGNVVARQVRRSVTGKTKAQVLARMREAQRLTDEGIRVPSLTLVESESYRNGIQKVVYDVAGQ